MLNHIENIKHTDHNNFFLIAGPCVIESEQMAYDIAREIKAISDRLKIPFIFKGSYRKANRSKSSSFTGIGDEMALKVLAGIRNELQVPVITDIHTAEEAQLAAPFVDIIQIPAFLCRQTDLLTAAAKTNKCINIKKGQFLSGEAMRFAARKVSEQGNNNIMLTERGAMFGYQDLIVDYRNIMDMQDIGYPVVLDMTHSLQQPNQSEGVSGGSPRYIELLGRAGVAVGVDGLFIETHPNPSEALSDGSNMLQLNLLEGLLSRLVKIRQAVNKL
jgi:2-dehydro-3-deoxyphosphooctonate aldolase (KDO 8-P synthase)